MATVPGIFGEASVTGKVRNCGPDGRAYALLSIAADKLIVLRDEPQFAAV